MNMETVETVELSQALREIVGFYWNETGEFMKAGGFKDKPVNAQQCIQAFGEIGTDKLSQFPGFRGDALGFIIREYLRQFPIPFHYETGERIHDIFENHRPGSCMRHRECRRMREFYVENADLVGTVHWMKSEHRLLESDGSFLLWNKWESTETGGISVLSKMFRDRIYSNGWISTAFSTAFTDSVDSWIRERFHCGTVVNLWGNSKRHTVSGLRFHGDDMPWMDSLAFARLEGNGTVKIATYEIDDSHECRDCGGTDITGEPGGKYKCCHCGSRISEDECYHTEYGDGPYCESCYGELFTYSEYDGGEYDSGSVSSITCIDALGREREFTICDDSIASDFRTYGGELYSVEYIHRDQAVETESGIYVSCDEVIRGEIDSTLDDIYPPESVNFAPESFIVPWGESDSAYKAGDLCYYRSGDICIPTVSPVPPGFYPNPEIDGEFYRNLGNHYRIAFDSTGTTEPYRIKIRSRRIREHAGTYVPGFRFPDYSSALHAVSMLSKCLRSDSVKYLEIVNWDNETMFDRNYLNGHCNFVRNILELPSR